jgi:hypothetical protein
VTPMGTMYFRLLFIGMCLLALAGCLKPGTVIESNTASDLRQPPKRIFVIAEIGSRLGATKIFDFASTFSTALQVCGVDVRVFNRSTPNVNDDDQNAAVRKFRPDAILTVVETGYSTTASILTNTQYDLKLFDLISKKTIWRANVNLTIGEGSNRESAAEVLANDVVNRFKKDGLVTSCVTS